MKAKEIYDILRAGGLSHAGALGMIGNMMAEAGPSLPSNIAQRGTTKLSDAQYTAAADNGLIDFAHDGVGYGLYQLTYHKRKANYLNFAKAKGVSVGDGEAQCEFCLKELREDYPILFKTLCESNDIDQCTDLICTQFERPAVNNLAERRQYAHEAEAKIAQEPEKPTYTPPVKDPVQATFPPNPSVKQIQYVMWDNDYWPIEKINGYKSKEFFAKLREFVDDMEKC